MDSLKARGGKNPHFHNLNFDRNQSVGHRTTKVDYRGSSNASEKHLNNFIWAHNHLVDTEILEKLNVGDKAAMEIALEQIHFRSLEMHKAYMGRNSKENTRSFKEILKDQGTVEYENEGNLNSGWTQVSYKRKKKIYEARSDSQVATIFLYGIPEDAKGRDIWSVYKECGRIIDIVLPKKRDKRGKRFGFVKTTDEKEAGAIINNAKMDRKLGSKIRMSINDPLSGIQQKARSSFKKDSEKMDPKIPNKPLPDEQKTPKVDTSSRKAEEKVSKEKLEFSKKLFEFTEVEVDEDVEKALMESKIGYTWFEEDVKSMQERFRAMGLEQFKVISLAKRKFLISKDKQNSWDDFNKSDLTVWFNHIRNYEEEDHVISRVTWLECRGLPMPAWKEENLRAFTDRMGKWVSWTYQSDNLGEFFNPLICIDLTNQEQFYEEMTILYKGKQIKISFKEITDMQYLKGKATPMDFVEEELSEVSKVDEDVQGRELVLKEDTRNDQVLRDNQVIAMKKKRRKEGRSIAEANRESLDNESFKEMNSDHGSINLLEQDNVFTNFRQNSNSSEICSFGSALQGDPTKSDSKLLQTNLSSQSTLCSGVVRKLKVKSNRGRPRKVKTSQRNPFEIGGKFKLKSKGRGKSSLKARRNNVVDKCLQIIPAKVLGSSVKQALEILEAAENMGLSINGDREVVVKEIAKKIELNEL